MTATLSAAALRMPHTASVAAPAPLAPGASAEPRSPLIPATLPGTGRCELGGITSPAFGGRRGGTESSDRFGGRVRTSAGNRWYRQDVEQLAGGGPLRG